MPDGTKTLTEKAFDITRTCLKIFPPDIFVFLLRYTVKLLILTIIDHAFYQADIVALTVFNIL